MRVIRADTSFSCSIVLLRLSIVGHQLLDAALELLEALGDRRRTGWCRTAPTRSPNPGAGLSAMARNRSRSLPGQWLISVCAYASSGSQVHTRLRSP